MVGCQSMELQRESDKTEQLSTQTYTAHTAKYNKKLPETVANFQKVKHKRQNQYPLLVTESKYSQELYMKSYMKYYHNH